MPLNNAKRAWASLAINNTSAVSTWLLMTALGGTTLNQGGGYPIPGWAKSIDCIRSSAMGDGATAIGTVHGFRLSRGVSPSPQITLGTCVSQQTTSAQGGSSQATVHELDTKVPFLHVTPGGTLVMETSVGSGDDGGAASALSVRWCSDPAPKPLWFQAATAQTTGATDLLATGLTAFATDTTFPFRVPVNCEGIRMLGHGFASDGAAAGSTAPYVRMGGQGIVPADQDVTGPAFGGDAAATHFSACPSDIWDDWLQVLPNNNISLLAGYTGVDSGTECHAFEMGFQLSSV